MVPFRGLLVVLCQGKHKLENLLLRDAGEIALTKPDNESDEDKLTGFDGIFFGIGLVVLHVEIDCL